MTQLCSRHDEAREMSKTADVYFQQLSASSPEGDRQEWETEIKNAESSQMQNPESMDILGARSVQLDEGATNHDTSIQQTITQVEEWIRLGLDMEEKQCVRCPYFIRIIHCVILGNRLHIRDGL